ncbi:hypothetical protein PN465_10370 [Nodularia spumigena CS-584]|jgi:tetratricopeptide (TPR) repeat protein|uniref:Uncharacterized protein n=1 Tax=Nodularia spumigena UHCC 0060 TaxID=3110300 RepID=A0ABU5UXH0_NODSP|nr:hypothetical protein [Nodularia spumigena]AHJ29623.1 hypothetical protein NSP_32980 [Nodularia spumigena CCY9414]EAW43770.1 hypothetical protein N9414_10907 [Nodularia spumigena CCY9414]MDB9382624.1 hypothetical protein [Nodularia spumigena CS-584]MEA5527799.1 hypothetical protein [Nodularia spumigena UHCC 0143]MEA5554939.1 hypothetical protein [Nodularia spumigena CH309]
MLFLSRQAVITPLVGCLCLLGVGWIQFPQLQSLLRSKQDISLDVLEREINTQRIRLNFLKSMPSFGYDNLIANGVYLSYLQYFGDDEAREKTGYGLSPEYFEIVLERDPRFLAAYLSLSTGASIYAGMPERSIAIMDKGLQSLSPWVPQRSYYVWRYKGIDELLFLGDTQSAEKSFATAAKWASNFSDRESQSVAAMSRQTSIFLSQNPNSKNAQISAWTMVLNNQFDEKTTQRAIREIEALGGKVTSTPEGNMISFPPSDE